MYSPVLSWVIFIFTLALLLFIISFFRVPARIPSINEKYIVCPADGKVVVIEEITDVEYFHDRRLQVSIFMSPANVHRNVNPVSGDVIYSQYHKGKYLVAWNPKSSTENERHSVVIKNPKGSSACKTNCRRTRQSGLLIIFLPASRWSSVLKWGLLNSVPG